MRRLACHGLPRRIRRAILAAAAALGTGVSRERMGTHCLAVRHFLRVTRPNVSQPHAQSLMNTLVSFGVCYRRRKRQPRKGPSFGSDHRPLRPRRRLIGKFARGRATKLHTPLTVRKTVQEIQSSAICNEQKQTPRIRVSHRKHPKPWNPKKPISCLGCKRSRVQISAARPNVSNI